MNKMTFHMPRPRLLIHAALVVAGAAVFSATAAAAAFVVAADVTETFMAEIPQDPISKAGWETISHPLVNPPTSTCAA